MSNLKNKKKVNWTRILCLILAIIMVGGAATLGITIVVNQIFAVEIAYDESDYTFSSETDGDIYIAVGLMYGSSITVGFEVKAPYGFVVGSTVITEDKRSFDPFYRIDSNIASATVDANLTKKAMTYYLTDNPDTTVIGGYHLELTNTTFTSVPLEYLVEDVGSMLEDDEFYPIPAYIGGEMKIRLGDFATEAEALAALGIYAGAFHNYSVSVVGPSKTAVSVVNPETDEILFEYDSLGYNDNIGFMAYQADEFTSYIQTPADNLYEGVMSFIPTHTDTYTGVSLTNLIDLEGYTEGVLPYELNNSWSREVLRTFAITIRSYAIANYCKWYNKYGFDMTATTSDQVYRGRNRVNDAIVDAVSSTEGVVMVYDGKVISAYYSSSVGGSTVGSQYVWGSARGYLTTVQTPWEKYTDYNNGIWYSEVDPYELCNTLRTRGGYTDLSGSIVSIDVERVQENPDYVYSLTFTDSNGTKVKVNRSDAVRTTLSSYLKSANFSVGKGAIERTYNKVHDIRILGGNGTTEMPKEEEIFTIFGYITNDRLLISDAIVLTDSNEAVNSEYPTAYVLTSTGRKVIMSSAIATADEYENSTLFEYDKNKITRHEDDEEDPFFDGYEAEETEESTSSSDDTDDFYTETEYTYEDEDYYSSNSKMSRSIPRNAYEVVSEFDGVTVITTLETITETITASSSENFIFAGKGWGHGVGISQYGAKDLSDAGASAEDIISIYFTGVEIIHRSALK